MTATTERTDTMATKITVTTTPALTKEQQDTYTKLVSSPEVKAAFMEQLEAMIQAGIEHNKKNGKIA